MTPQEKQRIEQIEARQNLRSGRVMLAAEGVLHDDVDFLLSLVKSREAGDVSEHINMEIVERLETPARIVKRWLLEARNGRALESVLLERDRELLERYIARVAASMRSACVEKLRERANRYQVLANDSLPNDQTAARTAAAAAALNSAANELESLSIEKPKEQ